MATADMVKPLTALSASLALLVGVSAAPSGTGPVSYDGYKVFRVSFPDDEVDKVKDIISRLSLTTWKGAPRAGRASDIVVTPSRLADFAHEVAGFDVVTMHEDLGASIAAESNFQSYAGG